MKKTFLILLFALPFLLGVGEGPNEWSPPSAGGGAPSGSAGGDLTGTYPNPEVTGTDCTGTEVLLGDGTCAAQVGNPTVVAADGGANGCQEETLAYGQHCVSSNGDRTLWMCNDVAGCAGPADGDTIVVLTSNVTLNNSIVRVDGTGGSKGLQDSGVTISDTDVLTVPGGVVVPCTPASEDCWNEAENETERPVAADTTTGKTAWGWVDGVLGWFYETNTADVGDYFSAIISGRFDRVLLVTGNTSGADVAEFLQPCLYLSDANFTEECNYAIVGTFDTDATDYILKTYDDGDRNDDDVEDDATAGFQPAGVQTASYRCLIDYSPTDIDYDPTCTDVYSEPAPGGGAQSACTDTTPADGFCDSTGRWDGPDGVCDSDGDTPVGPTADGSNLSGSSDNPPTLPTHRWHALIDIKENFDCTAETAPKEPLMTFCGGAAYLAGNSGGYIGRGSFDRRSILTKRTTGSTCNAQGYGFDPDISSKGAAPFADEDELVANGAPLVSVFMNGFLRSMGDFTVEQGFRSKDGDDDTLIGLIGMYSWGGVPFQVHSAGHWTGVWAPTGGIGGGAVLKDAYLNLGKYGLVAYNGSHVPECTDDYDTGGPPQTTGSPDGFCDSDGTTGANPKLGTVGVQFYDGDDYCAGGYDGTNDDCTSTWSAAWSGGTSIQNAVIEGNKSGLVVVGGGHTAFRNVYVEDAIGAIGSNFAIHPGVCRGTTDNLDSPSDSDSIGDAEGNLCIYDIDCKTYDDDAATSGACVYNEAGAYNRPAYVRVHTSAFDAPSEDRRGTDDSYPAFGIGKKAVGGKLVIEGVVMGSQHVAADSGGTLTYLVQAYNDTDPTIEIDVTDAIPVLFSVGQHDSFRFGHYPHLVHAYAKTFTAWNYNNEVAPRCLLGAGRYNEATTSYDTTGVACDGSSSIYGELDFHGSGHRWIAQEANIEYYNNHTPSQCKYQVEYGDFNAHNQNSLLSYTPSGAKTDGEVEYMYPDVAFETSDQERWFQIEMVDDATCTTQARGAHTLRLFPIPSYNE